MVRTASTATNESKISCVCSGVADFKHGTFSTAAGAMLGIVSGGTSPSKKSGAAIPARGQSPAPAAAAG
jgi:hypothetical protein